MKHPKRTHVLLVKKPATNSDSASGRSKGALLVSAMALIIKSRAIGKSAL